MAAKQMTYRQWKLELGPAINIEELPLRLKLTPRDVANAVRAGDLPMHTFRARDGRVVRMVRTRDVEAFQLARRPLSIECMRAALSTMMNQEPARARAPKRRTA